MTADKSISFTKIERATAYKTVSDAIAQEIIEGRLRPGSRLPSEQALASQFGVNRSTLREGIRLLEETGMIRRESDRRLVVSRPSYGSVSDRTTQAMILHEITFRELWEAMMAIEPEAAALAARKCDKEIVAKISENVRRTRASLADTRSLISLDIEFHALIVQAAGNRALTIAREPLSQLFYPVFEVVMTRVDVASARLLAAHEKIARAIENSDVDQARDWMRRHIADLRKGYEFTGLDMDIPAPRGVSRGAAVRPELG
jgi:GntR family transcriptional regulator, transcriptional repressor for pyruvate dehydrogenase complex